MIKKSKIPCPLRTKSILWEGAFIINLINELQEFLKTRMKQVSDLTFGTYWICTTCDRSKEYDCWGKTAEFCAKKGLDWQIFTEALNSFSGFAYDIKSDADVLNRLQVNGESDNKSKNNESKIQAKYGTLKLKQKENSHHDRAQ